MPLTYVAQVDIKAGIVLVYEDLGAIWAAFCQIYAHFEFLFFLNIFYLFF